MRVLNLLLIPGLRTPVKAMGPSSMIRLTKTWPAAHFIVQPMPLSGSLTRVILFNPANVCVGVGVVQRERERERDQD